MKKLLFYCLILSLASSSCLPQEDDLVVMGLKPVYTNGDWKAITSMSPQPLQNLGKFYYKDEMIFVSETRQGIHIIDNTNPENPQNVKFIAIPGVLDIAIKNNILYADNFTDLVALNIADLENIEVVNRVENLYPEHQNYYPANFEGYFECVDPEKGVVIGWEEVELRNPQCRR
jgi:hypothetical protein